jgi:anaerobic selenocysteine-containing dehydrogenase
MMSAEIANEILEAPEHPIRAMICVGGNLAAALPDQKKAVAALRKLDLLICIDPRMTATTRLAHYVIAPKLQYERADATLFLEGMFQQPFCHVTGAVTTALQGSDVVDDWYALGCIAYHAGKPIALAGHVIAPESTLETEEILQSLTSSGRLNLGELLATPGGTLSADAGATVGNRTSDARFSLVPPDVAAEIHDLSEEMMWNRERTGYQLVVRRHRELMNSLGSDFAAVENRFGANPAYLNPKDMQALGLRQGQPIHIVRDNTVIDARAVADKGLRPGVVSISHCWSGNPDQPQQATNILVNAEEDLQDINHMPVMTGFYVEVRAADTRGE